ncbi:MAG: Imm26 family immunity protein [Vulcanimicrobiaceae bacterium]
MKRRYREGDWFAVPLGSGREVVGVIARQDRSRLFGYFFALGAEAPVRARLEALQPSDALWRGCFLGDGLEDRRWRVIAKTLAWNAERWPLPPSLANGVEAVPAARFEPASLIETRLRGTTDAFSVREIRSPLDVTELPATLAPSGRVQFSASLDAADMDVLVAFLHSHPGVELRIHGHAREPFDASILARFAGVKRLVFDVAVPTLDALEPLAPYLETLTLGRRLSAPFAPPVLPHVRRLELHAKALRENACAALPALRTLVLVDTPMDDLSAVSSFTELEQLAVRFGSCASADFVAGLAHLQHLELRGLRGLHALPAVGELPVLRTLVLAALPQIRDLRPVIGARALERVEILAMEQLRVEDLHCLRELVPKASFAIDIGGRRKNREVYRWLGTSLP